MLTWFINRFVVCSVCCWWNRNVFSWLWKFVQMSLFLMLTPTNG